MDKTLESLAVVVGYFPEYFYKNRSVRRGRITITKQGLDILCRWYIFGDKSYHLDYREITGYSVSMRTLYLTHTNTSTPKYISIYKYLPFGSGDEELAILSQALEQNGISQKPLPISKTAKALMVIYVLLLGVLFYLLTRSRGIEL